MIAAVLNKFGPPDVLSIIPDQPKPWHRPGEVLVAVHASSVNPIDCKFRNNEVPRLMCWYMKVLGRDFAGVVLEADAGSCFLPGNRVFGFTEWWKQSAYAEEVSVPEAWLAPMPESISFEQAAALPLVAVTAWQALDVAALQPGQRVLIHAGAGGVGTVAIQLAKARGLHVTTTCSTRNVAFVRELGADEVVDYTEQRFEETYRNRPFDGIIDVVGGDYETRSFSVLKRSGVYVDIGNSGWIRKYGNLVAGVFWLYNIVKGRVLSTLGLGPRYHLISVRPDGRQLAAIGRLVQEGTVRPIIDRELPLERISEAHEYVERGHARSKVVLRIREE